MKKKLKKSLLKSIITFMLVIAMVTGAVPLPEVRMVVRAEEINGLTYNTEGNYYKIPDAAALNALASYVNAGNNCTGLTFKQTADIDMQGVTFTPIGNDEGNPVFRGTYDGDGYVIKNISHSISGTNKLSGLFGDLWGTVKNVNLKDCNFTAYRVGAIAGQTSGDCLIQNCNVLGGTITGTDSNPQDSHGSYMGGIAGNFNDKTATSCFTTAAFSGDAYHKGPVVGWDGGTVTDCYYVNTPGGNGKGTQVTGGFITLGDGITISGDVWRTIGKKAANTYYFGKKNDTITLSHADSDGYIFNGYTSNDVTITNGAFTMPAANVTVSATFANIPATAPTITKQPGDLSLTYGYTTGNTLTVAASAADGHTLSYQWYSNTSTSSEGGTTIDNATSASYTVPTGKNAGTTEYYYCVVTATRVNGQTATTASGVATVSVGKATPTITTAPTAKDDLIYKGQPQALITAGSATGGEMKYSLEENGIYSTGVPERTAADDYTVWYKVDGDENHNDIAPASVTASIAKEDQAAPTLASIVEITSGDTAEIPDVTTSMEYSTDNAAWTDCTAPFSVGKGVYYIRLKADANHNASAATTVIVKSEDEYVLMVSGGTGSGGYVPGASVSVSATVPAGERFVKWTPVPGDVLTDEQKTSASVTFAMPDGDVTLSATFEDKPLESVSLPATLSLDVGATQTLTPTFTPSDFKIKTVTWESDDTSIVTVDADGRLTAVDDGGPVNITVTSSVDDTKTAVCAVTVTRASSGGDSSGGVNGGGSGGGGTVTPEPEIPDKPDPAPEPITEIDPAKDPSEGKTAAGEAVTDTKENSDGSVTETTKVKNTDGSTTEKEKTTETDGTVTEKTTVTEKDGTVRTQETVESADGSKTEIASETKENGDFIEKTVTTDADGKTSEASASKTTDPDTKTVTETENTRAADGATTDYLKTTEQNEDYTETFVAKDATGNVTESREASRKTDETTGAVTEKSKVTDKEGTVESEKTEQTNGDYVSTETKSDADGKLLEKTEASKTSEANGDFIEKSETTDADGKPLESTEKERRTDENETVTETVKTLDREGVITEQETVTAKDGSGQVSETVTKKDGSSAGSTVQTDKTGTMTGLSTTEKTKEGTETKADYTPAKEGISLGRIETTGDEIEIPDAIPAADGSTYSVTEIGKGAMQGATGVTLVSLGANIQKICANAFRGAKKLAELVFGALSPSKAQTGAIEATGKKSTIVFGKNALKGTSKNLVIRVSTKADKKAVKKQLKKAGNTKAKVKVIK